MFQVAVQLPMFNERAVCQAIIDSACEMHWPSDRFCVQVRKESDRPKKLRLPEQCTVPVVTLLDETAPKSGRGFSVRRLGLLMAGMLVSEAVCGHSIDAGGFLLRQLKAAFIHNRQPDQSRSVFGSAPGPCAAVQAVCRSLSNIWMSILSCKARISSPDRRKVDYY